MATSNQQIGSTTLNNADVVAIANEAAVFTSTGGAFEFQNSNGTAASYASSLDAGSSVTADVPGATNTILFAGGLLNQGTITADALGSGNLVIDGRTLNLSDGNGVIGANFANTGTISVGAGNTLTISTSGTRDINGNALAASSTSPAQFVNAGNVDASGGILDVVANVTGNQAVGTAPEFNIGSNGKIDFGGSVAAGQTVNFLAPAAGATNTDTLRLENAGTFGGAVSNFGSVGDTLDLANVALTGVSYTNGVFSAQTGSGSTLASDSMAMSLTGATGVRLASDGGSGTAVTSVYTNPGSTISNISALRENATVTPASSASQTLSEAVTVGGATTTYLDSNQVNFADGTDYYGAGSAGGQAAILFDGLLGRQADPTSLGFYATQIDNGVNTNIVAQEIVNSPEYQAENASQSDANQVAALYQRMLGRAGSASEISAFTGPTIGFVASVIAASPEAAVAQNANTGSAGLANGVFAANPVAVQVQDAYQTVLGRSADAAGLSYWTQQLEGGVTQADLLNSFIGSAEFAANANAQSNAGYVTQIETNTQGGADASGLAYWTNQLNTGAATRTDVASAYANSATLEQRESSTITNHGIVTAS